MGGKITPRPLTPTVRRETDKKARVELKKAGELSIMMRKIVSVLIVIVMIVLIVPVTAEKDATMKDTANDISKYLMACMKMYAEFYEKSPISFSDEHAYALYSYLIAYNAMNEVYQAELYLRMPDSSVNLIKSMSGSILTDAEHEYRTDLENLYYEWQTHNRTKYEFLEKLIEYVNITIK